jgi:hypothetical protein
MAYTVTRIADDIVYHSITFVAESLKSGGAYPDLDDVVAYAVANYRTGEGITPEMVVTAGDINYAAGTITSIYPALSSFDEVYKAYTYAFMPAAPVVKGTSRNMLLLGGAILLLLLLPKKSGETETPAEV